MQLEAILCLGQVREFLVTPISSIGVTLDLVYYGCTVLVSWSGATRTCSTDLLNSWMWQDHLDVRICLT